MSLLPKPALSMTFDDAVERAVRENPTVQQASAGILRAQALLKRSTSTILPDINGSIVTTTLNTGRSFSGVTTVAQNQVTGALAVSALLFAPVQWAERAQARDQVQVAGFSAEDVRRQVAVATAEAYLSIITRRRVLEANVIARDNARSHYELTREQLQAGAGSLLDELRAGQALSADETLVEQSAMNVYSAQEALGVLVAAQGPADTSGEPALEVPADLQAAEKQMPGERSDVLLATAQQNAAARVLHDSWKDWLPSASALFQPQYVQPTTIFTPAASWRFQVSLAVPIFDFGYRSAARAERLALFNQSTFAREEVLRQAESDIRTARSAIGSAERALATARASAEEAHRVVSILDISYKAGAATEIEVLDAQLTARNADTTVANVEDQLRQAKLSLLVALGRFPG
jgi:outer membrane protein TolC